MELEEHFDEFNLYNLSLEYYDDFASILDYIHVNSTNARGRAWSCRETMPFRILLAYSYFPLLIICLFGNTINICVYAQTSLRKSIAIQMLMLKALVNTLFMVCLVTSAVHILAEDVQAQNPTLEYLYFMSWPYLLMLSNTFGSCAMWLTVLIIIERYLIVVYPISSRIWCTASHFHKTCAVLFSFCLLSALVYPISRHTRSTININPYTQSPYISYEFTLREGAGYILYEKIGHIINLVFFIVLPLLLLTFMSLRLTYILLLTKGNKYHHMSEKKCVTRISLATTLAHLILELPSTLPLMSYAINGPKSHQSRNLCTFSVVANFLGMCNASALFFIYVACSSKFRHLAVMRLKCQKELITRNHEMPMPSPSMGHNELSPLVNRRGGGFSSEYLAPSPETLGHELRVNSMRQLSQDDRGNISFRDNQPRKVSRSHTYGTRQFKDKRNSIDTHCL